MYRYFDSHGEYNRPGDGEMNAKILKGKAVAETLSNQIALDVEDLSSSGKTPCLAIVRAGRRPDDLAYERGIVKRCDALGITANVFELPENVSGNRLEETLIALAEDDDVHGILPFWPMPPQIDRDILRRNIPPGKDIDCFGAGSFATVFDRELPGFLPCTAEAVMETLHFYDIPIEGTRTVILGRSMLLGRPLSLLMLDANATVTICHSKTRDMASVAGDADILVSAMGRARMVDASYIKRGAVVIDVGINDDGAGGICGDVDFESARSVAGAVTPVPGGIGSVTTTILIRNTVSACKRTVRGEETDR